MALRWLPEIGFPEWVFSWKFFGEKNAFFPKVHFPENAFSQDDHFAFSRKFCKNVNFVEIPLATLPNVTRRPPMSMSMVSFSYQALLQVMKKCSRKDRVGLKWSWRGCKVPGGVRGFKGAEPPCRRRGPPQVQGSSCKKINATSWCLSKKFSKFGNLAPIFVSTCCFPDFIYLANLILGK